MKLDSSTFIRRHYQVVVLLFCLSLGFTFVHFPKPPAYETTTHRGRRPAFDPKSKVPNPKSADRTRVMEAYAGLPLGFEANSGQVDGRVKFLSRGPGYTLFLTGDQAVLSLKKPAVRSLESGKNQRRSGLLRRGTGVPPVSATAKMAVLQREQNSRFVARNGLRTENSVLAVQLVGANPKSPVRGMDQLPGRSNYFIGNDPSKWHVQVPTYAKVKYDNVYPGVDLVYYGNQCQLEYDFVVSPGADPSVIVLELASGESKIQNPKSKIDGNGDLLVKIDSGEVRFPKPIVYQVQSTVDSRQLKTWPATSNNPRTTNGDGKRPIEARFVLRRRNRVGFELASYDHSLPLVVDPVLVYTTYLGGSGADRGEAIAVDSSGDAYITGSTASTNFPTMKAEQGASGGNGDGFVAKIKADGSALVYSTYLGGSNTDSGFAIAVDSSGNAYVAGQTSSTDFPTTSSAYQKACDKGVVVVAGFCFGDAFLTKLDPTGSTLVYSTYLGGSNTDFAVGMALDKSGDAFVAGGTISPDFPTTPGAPQPHCGGYVTTPSPSCPAADAFVTELNPSGSALVYSTYLGGTNADQANAIAVDASGDAYVTGQTSSNDFPTTAGALQSSFGGNSNAFATKLSFAASKLTLAYSTYLGGSNSDQGLAIALDSSTNAYVAGLTNSANFPVAGAAGTFQGTLAGGNDGFVAKLDPAGKTLVYSTYLGGGGDDGVNGIAVDSSGRPYVTGFTNSTNFPLADPVMLTAGTGGALAIYDGSKYAGSQDAFISRLGPSGCGLTFSTYLGGHAADTGVGMALDSAGAAYVVGQTDSNDFPTVSPLQPKTGGGYDAFITKSTPAAAAATCLSPASLTFSSQVVGTTSTAQSGTLTNGGDATLNISGFTVNPSQEFAETNTCGGSVEAGKNCTLSVTFTPAAGGTRNGTIMVNDDDSSSGNPHSISLTGTGADFGITTFPSKATVTAGQSVSSVMVTLNATGGFNAMVSLSCANAPTGATCSFTPSSVTVSGSSINSTLAISTTARSSAIAPRPAPGGKGPPSVDRLVYWLTGLLALLLLGALRAGCRRPARAWALSLPLGALLLFTLVWSSCVSGTLSSGSSGTPAGTYSVAVTGTSGSLVHAASFALTVQ